MNELPPASGRPSVQSEVPENSAEKGPQVKFKERTVKESQPGKYQSGRGIGVASGQHSSSGQTPLKLRERNTDHSSDEGFYDADKLEDQDLIDGLDDNWETSSNFSTDSGFSESSVIEDDPEDQIMISPPNKQFPVPVNSKTAGASITISGASNDVDTQDASLTIEGGSKIDEQKLLGAIKTGLKKLWKLAVDFASKHKIAMGLALSILFVFIMASPAGPGIVGGLFGAALITSLGASIACALVGALIVDVIGGIGPYADQVPPQGSTQNQQSNQKDASTSDKSDKDKTVSGSQQDSGKGSETASDSEGSFFLTPKEKMAAASAAKGEGGSLAAGDGSVRSASTAAAGAQHEKEFSLEVFNTWLNHNFGRWTNKAQYAEFSKTLSGSDNYEDLHADNKLDDYLKALSNKRLDLSWMAGTPLEETNGSGPRQQVKLDEFDEALKRALDMLNPGVSHCRKMQTDLLRVLPKDEFPYVASDLDAPLLSVGDNRKSLAELPREEMAQVEASDFIRLTLINLRDFADRKEREGQTESE